MIKTKENLTGNRKHVRKGVTLIELLVVLGIISLLATIAANNYMSAIRRAQVAGCIAEIRQIEVACERYMLDTGQYPPSSTGAVVGEGSAITPDQAGVGCGYMYVALQHSLSGDANTPLSGRWKGPYLDLDREQLGDVDGRDITSSNTVITAVSEIQILDPWDEPYWFVRAKNPDGSTDYDVMGGVIVTPGTPLATIHKYENPNTFQIVSGGPNRAMFESPGVLDSDDLSNFSR